MAKFSLMQGDPTKIELQRRGQGVSSSSLLELFRLELMKQLKQILWPPGLMKPLDEVFARNCVLHEQHSAIVLLFSAIIIQKRRLGLH